ncbi:carbohydrate ABC transporter permease [Plastoroseomonas arctica]|uniref:Carbohydrate ABC transporter permease n=1 Tax=Plastoroseomonas arctica TaxID=1509237 RepID=A0AAF1KK02_9PROT|nr:carbohydrate ABC transporter permease [Plastoroseomonas arctica]MBR0656130.1 carbohydrate ABC transporter permease [Plastoroseomonas arctica]
MRTARTLVEDTPRLALLSLGACIMLAPYVWMFFASLKPGSEVFRDSLTLWPETFYAVENYTKALTAVPLARFLLNGVLVCSLILVFQIAFAVPAAYALAKLRWRGREWAFGLVMLGLLIPYHVPALPLYVGAARLGLLDSFTALVVPFSISVFGIFLFRQAFRALPDELMQAARIDGMGEFSIVWRVVMPNAWPAATAFATFSIVAHWNDLFWPLIIVQSPQMATPALGVLFFRAEEAGNDVGALMAAAVLVTAPMIALFLLAQRHFIRGIATAGLKG